MILVLRMKTSKAVQNEEDTHHIIIEEAHGGMRLDQVLSQEIETLSRTRLKKLIESGEVLLNDVSCTSPSKKLETGDEIILNVPPPSDWYPQAQDIPLEIIYEDDDVLVVNKQAGLVVHPGAGNKDGTLVNALLYHCGDSLSGIGGVLRPGIVHRLDKDTSGLMVVAKNDMAHQGLSEQFSDRTLSRKYKALVMGVPMPPKGDVDLPIGRNHKNRLLMAINHQNGKSAKTFYTVIERFRDQFALIECALESGRTHQIRVHMAAINHPLLGDPAYGPQPTAVKSRLHKAGFSEDIVNAVMTFPRQMLHAYALSFEHPATGEVLEFSSILPDDMQDIVEKLK